MVRLLSGLVLATAAVAAVVWLPALPLRILVCAVAALAVREYASLAHLQPGVSRALATAAVVTTCWVVSGPGSLAAELALALALAWLGVEVLALGHSIEHAAACVAAPIYLGAPLGMLTALRAAGWRAAILVMATVVVSDSAQYYVGRALGRRPLAPSISPKKTREGALGGIVAAGVLMSVFGRHVFPSTSVVSLAIIGAVLAVLGICGDLFESRLKRAAGVKDSATLIPGHGGVLDRVDALLFVVPAFYLFLRLQTGLTL